MWWIEYIRTNKRYLLMAGLMSWMILSSCSRKTITLPASEYTLTENQTRADHSCTESNQYIPYSGMAADLIPEREVRVIVHIIDSTGTRSNFPEKEGREYFKNLIDLCNERYAENAKLTIPLNNDLPQLPIKLKLKLSPLTNDPQDDGIYFHEDDDLFWVVSRGRDKNNYSRAVVNKYKTGADTVLNIFCLVHHPDSMKSSTYKVSGSGIALGTSLKVFGLYESGRTYHSFPGLLQHEIGHIFGLSHTWNTNDGCDDTPRHSNCWVRGDQPPCDTAYSNNMMDYNAWEIALSPCQIGRIHSRFHKPNSTQRQLCIETWCTKKEGLKPWTIHQDTIISRNIDMQTDIIIAPNISVTFTCHVSMPKDGKIVLMEGAQLNLMDAHLSNSCGFEWQGIELQNARKPGGGVKVTAGTIITDCPEKYTFNAPAID